MSKKDEMEQLDDRRMERKKRRKRNQLIAYLVIAVVIIAMIVGGFFGVRAINQFLKEKERIEAGQEQETTTETIEESTSTEEETTTIEEYTPEDLLNEVVDSCISEMSLEEKVAGLFIITPEQLTDTDVAIKAGDGTKEALSKTPVGGLIYADKNLKSEDQITQMLANTVSMSKYPIFLAVSEEGGSTTTIQKTLKSDKTDNMKTIGETGDSTNATTAYQTIGTYMSKYGFNLDFGPVADILSDPDNQELKERSFGSDPNVVSEMIHASVSALKEIGVTPCLKYFPGEGNAKKDEASGVYKSDRTLEQLKAAELIPFQAGIDAGAEMIMISNVAFSEINGDNTPASLSKSIITDLLRNDMTYNGVVITAPLNQSSVTEYYTADEACIKALKSGADMLLMPEDFKTAYEGVVSAVKEGTISEERIDDSLARVYRIKYAGTIDK